MKEIYLRLTKTQIRDLDALWVEVDNAYHDCKEGSVLALQLREEGSVCCVFVPHEQAKKVREIMKEIP